jgi:hypothetical protein
MLNRLKRWLSPDLAIDLGTANTLVAIQGEGVVLDEPSVVALQNDNRKILGRGTAVGKLAKQMLGRTPDTITAVRPIQNGVITDFELCEAMLRYFIQKAARTTPGFKPNVVIAVPGGITNVEKRAVFNSAERAGAGRIYLINESKAASIGAGLPISEPLASMICDIGGGTTEVAVLSLAEIVASKSLRIAGDEMDVAIVEYMKQHFALRIGDQTDLWQTCPTQAWCFQVAELCCRVCRCSFKNNWESPFASPAIHCAQSFAGQRSASNTWRNGRTVSKPTIAISSGNVTSAIQITHRNHQQSHETYHRFNRWILDLVWRGVVLRPQNAGGQCAWSDQ